MVHSRQLRRSPMFLRGGPGHGGDNHHQRDGDRSYPQPPHHTHGYLDSSLALARRERGGRARAIARKRRQAYSFRGSLMEASVARIRPQPPAERSRKARPTRRNPQTIRSRPPSPADGKEGVSGSSPELGLGSRNDESAHRGVGSRQGRAQYFTYDDRRAVLDREPRSRGHTKPHLPG